MKDGKKKDEDGKEKNRRDIPEFKYLSYMLNKNGGNQGQVRNLKRKVWGIKKRWFRKDFKRRMWLSNHVVLGVLGD